MEPTILVGSYPIEPTKRRPTLKALVQDWPITILVDQMCAEDSSQETNKSKQRCSRSQAQKLRGVQIPLPAPSDVSVRTSSRRESTHLSGILSTVPVESKLLSLLISRLSWDSSALARISASKKVIECLLSISCALPI